MPAEWHPHQATWLAFPHNRETWPTQLNAVRETFLRMMLQLLPGERVELLVADQETADAVGQQLDERGADVRKLTCRIIPTADAWIRDYGPNFLLQDPSRSPAALSDCPPLAFNDWTFNAWGGKYLDLARDNRIASMLAPALEARRFVPGLALEGGAIEVNGEGLCLTTEQCLLNPNRNPGLSPQEIEEVLCACLGVKRIVWLGQGLEGDDTDGHIDDIARFVDPRTVVCLREEDSSDANYPLLEENWKRLQAARDLSGRPLRLVPLPSPGRIEADGERLPTSYANFYIANQVVLVPTFAHCNDELALGTLRQLFPGRQVIGLDCRDLVCGLGAIHCATQQQPAPNSRVLTG